jgi:DNA-binding NarL/FixJ family response regulator
VRDAADYAESTGSPQRFSRRTDDACEFFRDVRLFLSIPVERTSMLIDRAVSSLRLTTRERELIFAITAGQNNKQIALTLGIREQSVKNQLSALYHKLGVGSRLQLAIVAMREGLIERRN